MGLGIVFIFLEVFLVSLDCLLILRLRLFAFAE
jgi:hypothetical protein